MTLTPAKPDSLSCDFAQRSEKDGGVRTDGDRIPSGVIEAHQEYLMRLAASLIHADLRSRLCPADLVQETLIVAFLKYDRFRGESNVEFRNWLEGILRRKYLEAMRKHRRTGRAAKVREVSLDTQRESEGAWDPPVLRKEQNEFAILILEQRELLLEEIRKLPEIDRALIEGKLVEELTIVEIARSLGLYPKSAYKRFERARKTLCVRLSARFEETC